MDTCAMTSTLRECCLPRPALAVRFVLPMVAEACVRAYLNADMDPNSNPERTERARVKPSERASREISLRRGRSAGPIATRRRKPAKATPMAITPPKSPSETLSISSSRAMRMRPAPNAARMESSW